MTNNLPSLYILKFEPILKEKVWGGSKLNNLFHKGSGSRTGESWEISAVENNVSQVSSGELKGKSLQWLIQEFKEKLVGEHVFEQFGTVFPLLFKFIDARKTLSIQVHPGDEIARERHGSFGKTEMWYVLDSDPEARLIVGFKNDLSKEEYLQALSQKNVLKYMQQYSVARGDAFVIEPGIVHAIGEGVLLAEIQQTSDITYRIYDWDRPDIQGNLRELHTDLALDAISFKTQNSRLEYRKQINVPVHVGSTPYFEVNILSLSKDFQRSLDFSKAFKVYMCIAGEAIMESNGFSEKVTCGQTVLVPAILTSLKFKTSEASFLEVYIP